MKLIHIKNITYIEIQHNKICDDYYFCKKNIWFTEHFTSKYDHSYLNMDEHKDELYVKNETLFYYPHMVIHFNDGTKTTKFFKNIEKLDEWLTKNKTHIKKFYLEL